MTRTHLPLPGLVLLLLLAAFAASGCDDEPAAGPEGTPPPECLIDATCGLHRRCEPTSGVCVACESGETQYNGIDDDCDPSTRDLDLDGDGDNDVNSPVAPGGDCDDHDRTRSSLAAEDCSDGIDNNCDTVVDCPDNTLPLVSFARPATGRSFNGQVVITVDASDERALANVEIFIDNISIFSSATPPFELAIDSIDYLEAVHTLRAVATDGAGNTAEDSVSIAFDNTPPTIRWLSPADGSVVEGVVPAEVEVSDNIPDSPPTVTILLDGTDVIEVLPGPTYTFDLDGLELPDGLHTLEALAEDGVGLTASATIGFDRHTDGLAFLTPRHDDSVRGQFPISVDLAVLDPAQRIDLYVASMDTPYQTFPADLASFDTFVDTLDPGSPIADGRLALTARLVDVATGTTLKQTRIYVTVDNTPPTVALVHPAAGLESALGVYQFELDVADASLIGFLDVSLGGGEPTRVAGGPPGRFFVDLDTTAFNDGDVTLDVVLEDILRNRAVVSLNTRVDNPGASVRIVAPADGSPHVSTVRFEVEVQDPVGVGAVSATLIKSCVVNADCDGNYVVDSGICNPTLLQPPAPAGLCAPPACDAPADCASGSCTNSRCDQDFLPADGGQAGAGTYSFTVDLTKFPAGELEFRAYAEDTAAPPGSDSASIGIRSVLPPLFATARVQPGPAQPKAVAVGLLSGPGGQPDAEPDLVIGSANAVTVLVGDGYGNFGAPIEVAATGANKVAVTDLDGDGRSDIIALSAQNVSVFQNLGGGLFGVPIVFPTAGGLFLAAADLDGRDGPDLVVVQASQLSVRLNDGLGALGAERLFVGTSSHRDLVISDANGDGFQDIVVATNGAVSVYLGNGAGIFGAPQNSQIFDAGRPLDTGGVALADLDGDGDLDAAVVDGGQPLRIFRNLGGGAFESGALQSVYIGSGGCDRVVAFKIDDDDVTDVACLNVTEQALVTTHNDGTGLQEVRRWALSPNLAELTVADVNRDRFQDLIVVGGDGVTVLLGNGTNEWQAARQLIGSGQTSNFCLGSMDPGAERDVILASKLVGPPSETRFDLYLGDPLGHFDLPSRQPGSPWSGSTATMGIAAADLDGDGDTDLVAISGSNYAVYDNDGTGSLSPRGASTPFGLPGIGAGLALGDLDGDGRPELVIGLNGVTDRAAVYANDGAGGFGAPVPLADGVNGIVAVRVLDMDGDGALDIAHVNGRTSDISVHYNDGTGAFNARVSYGTNAGPTDLALGRFDGDPTLADLVISTSGAVSYMRGDPVIGFTNAQTIPVAGNFALNGIAAADFNGDGLDDIGATAGVAGRITFLLNDGNVGFVQGPDFSSGVGPDRIAAADFDGDGLPDLAVLNTDGAVTLLYNDFLRLGCALFEIPYNGADDDCRGRLDVDATPDDDVDRDGQAPTFYVFDPVSPTTDCDDRDPSVYLGAPEVCGDGIDQDCDGTDLACP